MKDLVNQMISGTLRSVRRRLEARESGSGETARVTEALERAVEGTDPAIRYVRGYRKKLQAAIATALEYTEQLVSEIPGAIEVSRTTFVSNPYVNAFFVNVQDLQAVFSHSSEIREFMEVFDGSAVTECYALLCMHKSEKTVFGVELEGDVLRHDVQQIAVSFSDHRIYSPAPSEIKTREGLRQCLFQGLATHTLGQIMRLKRENYRLQEERQVLNTRLRQLKRRMASAGDQEPQDAAAVAESEVIRQKLATIEQTLLHSRLAAPEESLRQLHTVFSHPDDFVRLRKSTLRLNRMCIRVEDEHAAGPASTIDLTEVIISDESPRVVTLAKFPGEELQSPPAAPGQRLFS